MKTALIGHTGFVGGNLARQHCFDDVFNSANIEEARGRSWDLVVCAGAPGTKWRANAEPAQDRAALDRLQGCLDAVRAEHVVLVSTVDVYPRPVAVDEDTQIEESLASPYGRHRHQLERFVARRFPATTLRLPGLFGPGLKKNAIYDLLHDHQVERICPADRFQFYDLEWLWSDIGRARERGIGLLNLATEPMVVGDLARQVFGRVLQDAGAREPVAYDLRSKHAAALGGSRGYLYTRGQVLEALRRFVETAAEGGP